MDTEEFFLSQLPLIERVAQSVCRRYSVFGADAEDFVSAAKAKLIADDYAVLRRFEGRSRLETYLTTVFVNQIRDARDRKWGKWRPSTLAKALGKEARRLETLISRDGWPVDEAIELMCRNEGVELSKQELRDLAERLPMRIPKPRVEGEDKLPESPGSLDAEAPALEKERSVSMRQLEEALRETLQELDDEDRLILKMCYWDGFKVAKVAVLLGLPQRPLYSKKVMLLGQLRARLEQRGFGSTEISGLFEEPPP